MVNVELVYVARDKTIIHQKMVLEAGATVGDALNQSGLFVSHPETQNLPVGIFSRSVSVATVLKEGDRVELYRPLALDPKDNRRHRARVKK